MVISHKQLHLKIDDFQHQHLTLTLLEHHRNPNWLSILGTRFSLTLLIEISNNCMSSYHNSPLKEMSVVSVLALTDDTISKSVIKTFLQKVSISDFQQV